jgi:hypothetical protein
MGRIKRWKSKYIGHNLRRECLIKHGTKERLNEKYNCCKTKKKKRLAAAG